MAVVESSDLDERAELIIEAIWKAGGEADTSEIREYTDLSRGQIHYRLNGVLQDEDLVETRKVDTDGALGVTVSTLTEQGDTVAGRVMDENSGPALDEQVRELRAAVDDLSDVVLTFDGRVDYLEDAGDEKVDGDEFREEIDSLREEISGLEERLEEVEDTAEHNFRELSDLDIASEKQDLRDMMQRFENADLVNSDGVAFGFKRGLLLQKLVALDEEGLFDRLVDEYEAELETDW